MASPSKKRDPQLALRLEVGTPAPLSPWQDGMIIQFMGATLRLVLGTHHTDTRREGDALHLPLPPQATPRQVQDRTEVWLREQAKAHLSTLIKLKFKGTSAPPRLALSFATRSHWVDVEGTASRCTLRCNWRLIEQPPAVIEHAIVQALATVAAASAATPDNDLFGFEFSARASAKTTSHVA